MNKLDLRKKFEKLFDEKVKKEQENLEISISFDKYDTFFYGDILKNKDTNEINMFVTCYVELKNLPEKYKGFENEPLVEYRGSKYFVQEKMILEDLEKKINIESPLLYKGAKLNIKFSVGEFENFKPEESHEEMNPFLENMDLKGRLFQRTRLSSLKEDNVFNSEEVRNKFIELANKQRGKPEIQMRDCQKLMGGGTVSNLIEHIGDLTHRMNESYAVSDGNIEKGIEFILPKLESALWSLSRELPIEVEHLKSMKNNHKSALENNNTNLNFEDWLIEVNKELKKYSEYHSELPVYNHVQEKARNAAVCLGSLDFKGCKKNIEDLLNIIEEEKYVEDVCKYDPDYEKLQLKNKNKMRLR